MHGLSEERLEVFVVAPEELELAERTEIMQHLLICPSCRLIAKELSAFYVQLHAEKDRPLPFYASRKEPGCAALLDLISTPLLDTGEEDRHNAEEGSGE